MKNDSNNIHSDHNVEEDDDKTKKQAWGTWEELLLACAVKRHGFKDWDSVATEVRSRSSDVSSFSAINCKQKFIDLKLRFNGEEAKSESDDATVEEESIDGGNIPWLEELRSLRVEELRREVERYDVSILSLQLKVKKLEEERAKPDLEEDETKKKTERSEKTAEEFENRSMNESNSTETAGEEDDNNRDLGLKEGGSERSDSDELGESETSRRKKRKQNHDGDGGGEIRSTTSESEPLISLLDLIRSHPRGSLFERRLRSQENKEYKSLVKQHLDIETIQKKLKKGYYDSSSISFYRDLQLLFTNAIVFFPSSSSESMAALELRNVVYEEMRKKSGKSGPKLIKGEASGKSSVKAEAETSESSLSRQRSSAALVVCKRKSFGSAKASPSSSFSQKEETLSEDKENTVTGVRSSRRTSKVAATKTSKGKNKQKQTESKTVSSSDNNDSKQDTGKTEKKPVSADKKKSVADFLKRLKKNSPQKESKDQTKSGGSCKKESKTKPRELRSNTGSKKKAGVEATPVKRAPGRPQKKTAEASVSGKRGRETGSTGKDSKHPKKRTRR